MKQRGVVFFILALIVMAFSISAAAQEEHLRYTGTGPIDISVSPGATPGIPWNASGFEIRLHLSAMAAAGTLLVDVDSSVGTAYDCNIESYGMSGVKDYARRFECRIKAGDEVRIRWENAAGVTWGIEVIWE